MNTNHQRLQDEYNAYLTGMLEGLDRAYHRERMNIRSRNPLHWLARLALVLAYAMCLLGVVGCDQEQEPQHTVFGVVDDPHDSDAALIDKIESHYASRVVLEDRRCYYFADTNEYQCWLPDGVCEFKMPEGLRHKNEALGLMNCSRYAELAPAVDSDTITVLEAAGIASDALEANGQ